MRWARWLFVALLVAAAIAAFDYVRGSGEEIKADADHILRYISTNDWLAPTIAVVMCGISAALAIGYFGLWISPITASLWRLRKRVNQFADHASFAENFASIDAVLSRNKIVGHAWKVFHDSLVRARSGPPLIRNTTRPQSYINIECAFHAAPGLRLMSSIPGYLIGIGLLFTFVGLLAALSPAVRAVGSPDIQAAQKGLQDLLQASAFKFWTSIAGLLSSIVLAFLFRFFTQRLERAFESLCIALERKMVFVSAESISLEIEAAAREQLAETKKINTEMAFTIGQQVSKAITEQMPAVLSQSLGPLVDEVKRTTAQMGSANEGGIKSMIDQFSQSIQGAAGTEISQLGSTLAAVRDSIQSLHTALTGAGQNLSANVDASTRALTNTLQQATTAFEKASGQNSEASTRLFAELESKIDVIGKRLGQEASGVADKMGMAAGAAATHIGSSIEAVMGAVREQVGALSTSLQAVDATMKGQATALGEAAREARAVAQSFGSVARDLPAAVAPIRASAEQFASAGSSMALAVGNASSSIEQANNQSKRLGELLTQSSALLQRSWTAYQERFEKVDDDLKAAFASLASGLDQYQQRVHSFLAELDKSFSDALGRIAGAVQGLNNSVEELADAMGSKSSN